MGIYDVAVVGLGALGSAAVWQAVRKGAKVIGFEQFEFGHVKGASHDTSRIVRTSYDAPEYVALAKSAYRDWADLESSVGMKLLTVTGGIVVIAKDATEGPTIENYTASLTANNLSYELLSSAQVQERWPQITIGENMAAVYSADTGMAHASKSVTAMQFAARAHGADLRENTPVTSVTPIGGEGKGYIIRTPAGLFKAKKVILATDAWTNQLLEPLGAHIPLTIMQEQVTYYKPTTPAAFDKEKFPVWICFINGKGFYGFPTFGEPTIKAARDFSENTMPLDKRTFVHSPELLDELTNFMGDFISRDQKLQTLRTVTCQYAITPERQFVLGPLPDNPDVFVALGAGHAFKFAPVIGRVMAELAIDGATKEDISSFAVPTKATPRARL
ncbi:Monomeric sarcosine oxidase [Cyphellophora attinorum]|uniref:sarcosine oxidasee (formaldehyde-forming) n=1 Tax=Cyphellophora attinorum TaxID=1664694 RepID=A0A0N1HLH2_9EURO|nr:Monomeric sarcosine oxidase [Phialophora attinorum]KPI37872.1 Monomeric sarcosine oxidase [Phialophora attinorum]